VKVLFGREQISADLSFDQLAAHLPGWEIACCPPAEVAGHLDGVDVICPFGAKIGEEIISDGSFGLVHQFGVGLDGVDIETATRLGVLVARVPGDVGGNADSCAELAVLHLLALCRRLAPSGPRLLGVRARPELGGPAELELVAGLRNSQSGLRQCRRVQGHPGPRGNRFLRPLEAGQRA
jgi:hypothetical protein